MALQLSVVVVYPPDTGLRRIRRVMEGVLGDELDISNNSRVGDVRTRVIDVQVPDGFDTRAARRMVRGELPAVRIKMMWRFCESWWARHRWPIAIAIGGGIAVPPMVDLLPGRLREPPG